MDIKTLEKQKLLLTPVPSSGSGEQRFNGDGFLSFRQVGNRTGVNGYVQFFRGGQIEAVRVVRENDPGTKVLPAQQFEEDLLQALHRYLESMRRAGVALPILVGLAFHNVMGYRLAGQKFRSHI